MSSCPNQYKLDVNDRYQRGVALITSLSTASLFLPILFLKDIVNIPNDKSITDFLTSTVYCGWKLLATSIIAGMLYYYLSAKWVKLAWNEDTDICGIKTSDTAVEWFLNISYFLMMICFGLGMFFILYFILNLVPGGS